MGRLGEDFEGHLLLSCWMHGILRVWDQLGYRTGGPKNLCTKNGPTRFSRWYISFFPTMVTGYHPLLRLCTAVLLLPCLSARPICGVVGSAIVCHPRRPVSLKIGPQIQSQIQIPCPGPLTPTQHNPVSLWIPRRSAHTFCDVCGLRQEEEGPLPLRTDDLPRRRGPQPRQDPEWMESADGARAEADVPVHTPGGSAWGSTRTA